ncbi:DNA repair protein RecO [Kaistella palustris]|uniref:DNA repair protein RecO n=1 Tax=Kaistella palustris TaxID=493376 RepID=UPI00040DF821|nr:recombination protein O N-terminal domain-containing protein [Kaistella palustris]
MTTLICYLLSHVRYGDDGAVVNCFSEKHGYQSFFISKIYAPRNKKKSFLFPLREMQITLNSARSRNSLQTISKIETVNSTYEYSDININSILFFAADFLHQVLREEQNHAAIYTEISNFLGQLYRKNLDAHIGLVFKILQKQGISPLHSDLPFLNPEEGNFGSVQSAQLFDEELSGVWKNYIAEENIYQIKLSRNIRKKMIDSLMQYYQLHYEGFREPVSLAVIQQIYD